MTESEFAIVEGWLREAMEYGEERHNEPYEKAIQALEEVQAYRAIGTIEEFKALKQWKADIIESFSKYDVNSVDELMKSFRELTENERKCEDCAGCTNWKCDCENIRNKAIDEFAEALNKICAKRGIGFDHEKCIPLYVHEDGTWHSLIDDVVAQMKGEKE